MPQVWRAIHLNITSTLQLNTAPLRVRAHAGTLHYLYRDCISEATGEAHASVGHYSEVTCCSVTGTPKANFQ